ncbi:Protein of unknown function [Cotesia congregata]|uniref:Uncharacterized protein n=1 Tax=Cotesia congregata TaxID=51543 RepID=A0A8J2MDU4_COTCN|nr:Protein of unknown function [Cotesia congregata]
MYWLSLPCRLSLKLPAMYEFKTLVKYLTNDLTDFDAVHDFCTARYAERGVVAQGITARSLELSNFGPISVSYFFLYSRSKVRKIFNVLHQKKLMPAPNTCGSSEVSAVDRVGEKGRGGHPSNKYKSM